VDRKRAPKNLVFFATNPKKSVSKTIPAFTRMVPWPMIDRVSVARTGVLFQQACIVTARPAFVLTTFRAAIPMVLFRTMVHRASVVQKRAQRLQVFIVSSSPVCQLMNVPLGPLAATLMVQSLIPNHVDVETQCAPHRVVCFVWQACTHATKELYPARPPELLGALKTKIY
jgi:hypothetical protein